MSEHSLIIMRLHDRVKKDQVQDPLRMTGFRTIRPL
jgi:hypothetical protein